MSKEMCRFDVNSVNPSGRSETWREVAEADMIFEAKKERQYDLQ